MVGHYFPSGQGSWVEPQSHHLAPSRALREAPFSDRFTSFLGDTVGAPPSGEAAADTMETPPQSPFLLGIYEVPDASLASPPGDPQLALDHIPASRGVPGGEAGTQGSLQSDLLTAPAKICPRTILAEPRMSRLG